VKTLLLNEQVRRNTERLPDDLVIRITNHHVASSRSRSAILKTGRGRHRKYPPLAFTRHVAVMAATVLNSPRAVGMSVYIAREFVRLRTTLEGSARLAREPEELDRVPGRAGRRYPETIQETARRHAGNGSGGLTDGHWRSQLETSTHSWLSVRCIRSRTAATARCRDPAILSR
jgi:hypothetical protein